LRPWGRTRSSPRLEDAAAYARARGAPEAAADLLEHALRLDDDGDAAARRVSAAAGYHILAGDDRRARELLEAAIAHAAPGPPRAALRLSLGYAFARSDVGRAIALFDEALVETAGDPLLRARVLSALGVAVTADRRPAEGEPHLAAAAAAAEDAGDPALLAGSLGALAASRFFLGRGVDAALMARARSSSSPSATRFRSVTGR
jgi:hypothetical protein